VRAKTLRVVWLVALVWPIIVAADSAVLAIVGSEPSTIMAICAVWPPAIWVE